MQKNEENRVEKESRNTWESTEQLLASEIINGREATIKALLKALGYGTLLAVFVIGGLLFVNCHLSQTNQKNNQAWIKYLSEYDFVSQDGEGLNYFNSEVGGDVNNGTENKETEE